jgi:hypothetical protein
VISGLFRGLIWLEKSKRTPEERWLIDQKKIKEKGG